MSSKKFSHLDSPSIDDEAQLSNVASTTVTDNFSLPSHHPIPPSTMVPAPTIGSQTFVWRIQEFKSLEAHRSAIFSLFGEPFSLGFWPFGGMIRKVSRVNDGLEWAALSLRLGF